eukprot:scaffold239177_cov28-Tisochrysis_lutea.AAC.4
MLICAISDAIHPCCTRTDSILASRSIWADISSSVGGSGRQRGSVSTSASGASVALCVIGAPAASAAAGPPWETDALGSWVSPLGVSLRESIIRLVRLRLFSSQSCCARTASRASSSIVEPATASAGATAPSA